MKKCISVSEIRSIYKKLGINIQNTFTVRKDINVGTLNNNLNSGDLSFRDLEIKKISSYIY